MLSLLENFNSKHYHTHKKTNSATNFFSLKQLFGVE